MRSLCLGSLEYLMNTVSMFFSVNLPALLTRMTRQLRLMKRGVYPSHLRMKNLDIGILLMQSTFKIIHLCIQLTN